MLNKLLALFLFIIFLPIMVIVGIIIKLTSKGPIIYWSKRIGLENTIFMMPKFRTMKVNTPQLATHLLKDGESFSYPFGAFLRKTSLDELPQLWSILKGDMVFVGPRPALFNQDDLIVKRTQRLVHKTKPGITGWAQINGRDEISIDQKVQLDAEYVQRKSLSFDILILLKTVLLVIKKENIKH